MFDLRPYTEYQPASSPWIRQVPVGWQFERVKSLLSERSVKGFPDEPLLAATQSRGVILKSEYETRTVTASKDLHLLKLVEVGDFVISLRSFQGGIERVHHRGIVSPAYTILTTSDDLYRNYLTYVFKSAPFISSLTLAVTGIREGQNIDYGELSTERLPVPPAEEQAAIVKYLAHANARIDKAITTKRRLIALLDEHLAVELDYLLLPDSDDSQSVSIGLTSTMVQTGPFGSQLHANEYVRNGVPVVNPSHLSGDGIYPDDNIGVAPDRAADLSRHSLKVNDVVAARRGDLGRCDVVTPTEAGWLCGTGSMIIRLRPDCWIPAYFQLLFGSRRNKERLGLESVGSTMANLSAGDVSRMRLARPSLEHQRKIIREVRAAQQKVHAQRSFQEREIALLEEFRTRLVADVVTGQVDVRSIAASLPDVDPQATPQDLADVAEPLDADEALDMVGTEAGV